jgi:hypothetical protein
MLGLPLMAEEPYLAVLDIAALFAERYGEDYERKVTTKWIGGILRKRLGLRPQKSNGTFVIPLEDLPKLARLREKYGVREPEVADPLAIRTDPGDIGDFRDIPESAEEVDETETPHQS